MIHNYGKLIYLLKVIILVGSILFPPGPQIIYAQSYLREKSTFQAQDNRYELEAELSGDADPAHQTQEATSRAKAAPAGQVRDGLDKFIGDLGKGNRIFFRLDETSAFPNDKTDMNARLWNRKRERFRKVMDALVHSLPVDIPYTARQSDMTFPLFIVIIDILKNAYDGIVSFYDPEVYPEGPPKGYNGMVIISFEIKDNNLIIRITDNGMGLDGAEKPRKKIVRDAVGFYFGGEGLGLEKIINTAEYAGGKFELNFGNKHTRKTEAILTLPLRSLLLEKSSHDSIWLPAFYGWRGLKQSTPTEATGDATSEPDARELLQKEKSYRAVRSSA